MWQMGEKSKKKESKIIELKFDDQDRMNQEMNAFLQEELMREADELEAQLNRDPDLVGIGASDDLFSKIVDELKRKGIWEEEKGADSLSDASEKKKEVSDAGKESNPSEDETEQILQKMEQTEEESEKEAAGKGITPLNEEKGEINIVQIYDMLSEEDRRFLETGRRVEQEQKALKEKKNLRRKKMQRAAKRCGTVAAVLVLVIGVSMTSDANRRLVSQMWDSVTGSFGLKIATEYVDKEHVIREGGNEQEAADFQKASEELGIAGISLGYLPEEMEYLRCEIDELAGSARFFYKYLDTVFNLTLIKKVGEGVFYYALDNDIELSNIYTFPQEIEAQISKTYTEGEQVSYIAQLQYKNCSYILNGIISIDEMEKIVKNIYFL